MDNTSFERFAARVRREIDRQPIPETNKVDLKDRLTRRDARGTDDRQLSSGLSAASAFSLIDAYESLVATWQENIETSDAAIVFACRSALDRATSAQRLASSEASGHGRGFLRRSPFRDLSADDALLKGDFVRAIDLALSQVSENVTDIDALAVAAAGHVFCDREPDVSRLSPILAEVLSLLTTVRAKRGSPAKAAGDLAKLGLLRYSAGL